MKKLSFLFLLTLLPLMASAYDAQIDGIYYNFDTYNKQASVTSGSPKYTGSVTIPETILYNGITYSVTTIGKNAFYNCSGLSEVKIPNSVTSIGESAFDRCKGLASVNIGDGVVTIGDYAFYYCSSLTEVIIPNRVTLIGKSAFSGCSGLTSVTIGSSVTLIRDFAFQGCSGLTSVTCEATSVPSTGNNVFYIVPQSDVTLYVPSSALENYKTTSPWSGFGTIVALDDEPVAEGISIDETNFPDANFRNWVLAQDYGADGVLTETEIAGITSLKVSGKSIKSLQGIEYFTALKELDCYKSQLEALDLSHNTALTSLRCYANQLTSLDLSKNTKLTTLNCYSNQIYGTAMDELVASLPTVSKSTMRVIYNKTENNVMTSVQIAAAKVKGWTPYCYDGNKWNKMNVQKGSNIIQEGEYLQDITNYSDDKCTLTRNTIDDERVSQGECLRILPVKSNGTWNVTYNMDGIVPGKYNVHIVTLPKTMTDATATDLPVKYKIELQYNIQDGTEVINQCGAYSSTQNEITDVVVEGVDIYGGYVNITLSGNANAKKVKTETSEMYLDYIYLESATSTLRGDVNGDGEIGMPDVMFVVNYILGTPADTFNADAADANLDGEIGMPDVMFIVNHILNGKFPDEE